MAARIQRTGVTEPWGHLCQRCHSTDTWIEEVLAPVEVPPYEVCGVRMTTAMRRQKRILCGACRRSFPLS